MSLIKVDPKKVIIKVESAEDQENITNTRKTLKDIKNASQNKENYKTHGIKSHLVESKRKKMVHRAVQTSEITEGDLCADEPSVDYWKSLAETRASQLECSFTENEKLKDQLNNLEEENKICREMLDESRTLVEVLQEMLSDNGETES